MLDCLSEERDYMAEVELCLRENGHITPSVRRSLDRFGKRLGITPDRACELEHFIVTQQVLPLPDNEREYLEEVAFCVQQEGCISDSARRMLARLRNKLAIDEETARRIENSVAMEVKEKSVYYQDSAPVCPWDQKKTERVMLAQHQQIKELQERAVLIKECTGEIKNAAREHSGQLRAMSEELKTFSLELELDLARADLTNVKPLIELTSFEIDAIERRIALPPLEIISYQDWDEFLKESETYLDKRHIDPNVDPILQMLSITEIKDVLAKYRDNYGKIIPSTSDYVIVLLAGIMGGLLNEWKTLRSTDYQQEKLWNGNFLSFFISDDWRELAVERLAQAVGIDTTKDDLHELRIHFERIVESGTISIHRDLPGLCRAMPAPLKAAMTSEFYKLTGMNIGLYEEVILLIIESIETDKKISFQDLWTFVKALPETWLCRIDMQTMRLLGMTIADLEPLLDALFTQVSLSDKKRIDALLTIYHQLPKSWRSRLSDTVRDTIAWDIDSLERFYKKARTLLHRKTQRTGQDWFDLLELLPEGYSYPLSEFLHLDNLGDCRAIYSLMEEGLLTNDLLSLSRCRKLMQALPDAWKQELDIVFIAIAGVGIDELLRSASQIEQILVNAERISLKESLLVILNLPEIWTPKVIRLIMVLAGITEWHIQNIFSLLQDRAKQGTLDPINDEVEITRLLPDAFRRSIAEHEESFPIITPVEAHLFSTFVAERIQAKKITLPVDAERLIEVLPDRWKQILVRYFCDVISISQENQARIKNSASTILKGEKILWVEDISLIHSLIPEPVKQQLHDDLVGRALEEILVHVDVLASKLSKIHHPLELITLIPLLPQQWRHQMERKIESSFICEAEQFFSFVTYLHDFLRHPRATHKEIVEFPDHLPASWRNALCNWLENHIGMSLTNIISLLEHLFSNSENGSGYYVSHLTSLLTILPEQLLHEPRVSFKSAMGIDMKELIPLAAMMEKTLRDGTHQWTEAGAAIFHTLPGPWQAELIVWSDKYPALDIPASIKFFCTLGKVICNQKVWSSHDVMDLLQDKPPQWTAAFINPFSAYTGIDSTVWSHEKFKQLIELTQFVFNPAKAIQEKIDHLVEDNENLSRLFDPMTRDGLAKVFVSLVNLYRTLKQRDLDHDKVVEGMVELSGNIATMFPQVEGLLSSYQAGDFPETAEDRLCEIKSRIRLLTEWISNSGLNGSLLQILEKLEYEQAFAELTPVEWDLLKNVLRELMTQPASTKENEIRGAIMPIPSDFTQFAIKHWLNIEPLISMLGLITNDETDNRIAPSEEFIQRFDNVLRVLEEQVGIERQYGRSGTWKLLADADAFFTWCRENGLTAETFKGLDTATALVELLIRSWFLYDLYLEGRLFKNEPYAVRISGMLAGAHLLSNLPALLRIAMHVPPNGLNPKTLALFSKYCLATIKEYLKREGSIQNDLNDKVAALYKKSTLLLPNPPIWLNEGTRL